MLFQPDNISSRLCFRADILPESISLSSFAKTAAKAILTGRERVSEMSKLRQERRPRTVPMVFYRFFTRFSSGFPATAKAPSATGTRQGQHGKQPGRRWRARHGWRRRP